MENTKKNSYEHGGDIYTEGVLRGREVIDFSSNINPFGVPLSFREHISEAIDNCEKYPDIKYRELIKNLKNYLRKNSHVSNLEVIPGNGASEIIDAVICLFKSILIIAPSFLEYEKSARKGELEITYSYLDEAMEYDYKDIYEKLKKVDAVIIGNPNNPSGNIIDKESFKTILDFCEENGKVIIIDEAFVEFTGDKRNSYLEEANNYSCLFIIRAITKFFGMPGIRFGYGITKNKCLELAIKKLQNPWSINSFAETAVKYALKDVDYINSSLKWIAEERSFMVKELNSVRCIDKVYDTKANYVLCRLKKISCEELYTRCMKNGIAIRRAGNFKGLDEGFVRLAIKSRHDNLRLLEVLKNE
jgi:threonine-phosphate decarboxylase